MSNDTSHGTKVDSIIRILVKEWMLQDGGGKNNLIEVWMIVGIDSLGGHELYGGKHVEMASGVRDVDT